MDSIGPRLTRSPGIKSRQDWLVKTYASWGIQARNEQWGTWLGWKRGHAHIDPIAPRSG
jgi:carboxypeptidase Q